MIKAVIHRLKIETRRPENRLRLGGKLKGSLRVAQQDVPLQLQGPVKAGTERNAAPEHPRFERRLLEGRTAPHSAAKALHETLNAQNDQLAELVFADKIERACRLEPHLVERIATGHQIGEAMLAVEAGVNHLAGFPDGSDCSFEAGQSIFDWGRSEGRAFPEAMCA